MRVTQQQATPQHQDYHHHARDSGVDHSAQSEGAGGENEFFCAKSCGPSLKNLVQ